MIDTQVAPNPAVATKTDRAACMVHPGIELTELLKLVVVVEAALKLQELNQTYIVYSRWLSTQFAPNQETKFWIDPNALRSTAADNLSLTDVQQLLISIHDDLEQNRTKEIALLTGENAKIVGDYFKIFNPSNLIADRVLLQLQARDLAKVVDAIINNVPEKVEEIKEVGEGVLPEWLEATRGASALSNYASDLFKEVVIAFASTQPDAIRVVVRQTAITPIPLREYLDEWLRKLYNEVPSAVLPAQEYLEDERFNQEKINIPRVTSGYNDSDLMVLDRWRNILFPAIDAYLKSRGGGGGALFLSKKEEKTDKKETDLTNDAKLEDTRQKFEAAGVRYSEAAARLNAELLPLFFSLHGLGTSVEDLQFGLNPDQLVELQYIQREFGDQLGYVFRKLTPEQIKALNTPGGRMEVLRMLFARLASRREFNERIKLLAEKRAEVIVENSADAAQLTPDQKTQRVQEQLKVFYDNADKVAKLRDGDVRVEQAFERAKTVQDIDVIAGIAEVTANATKGDFQKLFNRLVGGTFAEGELTFEALDSYIADRFDPERIRSITSPTQFLAVFGFDIPAGLLDENRRPTKAYTQFLLLCAEYVHLRRTRLADHYQVEAISHSADLDLQLPAEFDEEERAQLAKTHQRVIDEYRDKGGAEVIIVARSSNRQRVNDLIDGGNPLALQVRDERIHIEEEIRASVEESLRRRAIVEYTYYEVVAGDGVLERDSSTNVSPLNPNWRFRHIPTTTKPSKKANRLNVAKMAFAKARGVVEGAAEGAIVSAVPVVGPALAAIPLPKEAKRGLVGAIGIGIANVAAHFYAGVVAKIGGIVAGGIGFAVGGPIGGVIGLTLGTEAGYAVDKFFGFVGKAGITSPFSLGALPSIGNPFATGGAATSGVLAPSTAESLRTFLSSAFSTSAATVWGTVGIAGLAVYETIVVTGAFLPPLPTLTPTGEISKYVTITKTPNIVRSDKPTEITYSLKLQAKEGYTITITDPPTEEMTIQINTDTNKQGSTKVPAEFDAAKQKITDALKPGTQITTTPLELEPYKIPFPTDKDDYKDASIINTFGISFSVQDKDGQVKEGEQTTFTANTQASVCFGNCPQPKAGCWPATGYIGQGPFERNSINTHNHIDAANSKRWVYLDAVDILKNHRNPDETRANVPIYSPFSGSATFYTYTQTNKGGGYGNYVVLKTGTATLLFGHLAQFSSQFQPGNTYQVKAGEQLGIMGGTGNDGPNTWPIHLHYELRPAISGTGPNQEPAASKLEPMLPEKIIYSDLWEVPGSQQVVSKCGGI